MLKLIWLVLNFTASATPAVDVYSFGMCALEMAALEIQGNGDSGTVVTEDHVRRTIDSLDDVRQKDFIQRLLLVNFILTFYFLLYTSFIHLVIILFNLLVEALLIRLRNWEILYSSSAINLYQQLNINI